MHAADAADNPGAGDVALSRLNCHLSNLESWYKSAPSRDDCGDIKKLDCNMPLIYILAIY